MQLFTAIEIDSALESVTNDQDKRKDMQSKMAEMLKVIAASARAKAAVHIACSRTMAAGPQSLNENLSSTVAAFLVVALEIIHLRDAVPKELAELESLWKLGEEPPHDCD